jgi:hypothetical protein
MTPNEVLDRAADLIDRRGLRAVSVKGAIREVAGRNRGAQKGALCALWHHLNDDRDPAWVISITEWQRAHGKLHVLLTLRAAATAARRGRLSFYPPKGDAA